MRRAYKHSRTTYVSGNNAMVLEPINKIESVAREKKLVEHKKSYSVNPKGTWMVALSILMMLAICIIIIQSQIAGDTAAKQVVQLERRYRQLKQENGQMEARINQSIQWNEIKEIAMEEYGMVYPTQENHLDVSPEEESYTIQYASIEKPKEEKITMGNMLAFITRGW